MIKETGVAADSGKKRKQDDGDYNDEGDDGSTDQARKLARDEEMQSVHENEGKSSSHSLSGEKTDEKPPHQTLSDSLHEPDTSTQKSEQESHGTLPNDQPQERGPPDLASSTKATLVAAATKENRLGAVETQKQNTLAVLPQTKLPAKGQHVKYDSSPPASARTVVAKRTPAEDSGRPKPCEMSDPSTGEVIQRFASCSQAARETGIGRLLIGKVCHEGGGVVDGVFFRYAESAPGQQREMNATLSQEHAAALGKGITTTVRRSSNPTNLPHQHSLSQAAHSQTQSQEKVPYFDVTTLVPVRKKQRPPLRPKKVIELVEKISNSVIVCFRGTTDASRALGLDRKVVNGACHAYGTPHEYDLGTFTLRYAQSGAQPQAYEFGAHREDFRPTTESYSQIMGRWRQVFDMEQAQRDKKQQHEEHQQQLAAAAGNPSSQRDRLSPTDKANEDAQQFRDQCLVCQKTSVQVVFEPCHHCILCSDCAERSCRRYCPLCRTPITNRLQPDTMRPLRPRIYSAYAFM